MPPLGTGPSPLGDPRPTPVIACAPLFQVNEDSHVLRLWLSLALMLPAFHAIAGSPATRQDPAPAHRQHELASHIILLLPQSEIQVDDGNSGIGVAADPVGLLIGALLNLSAQSTRVKRRAEYVAPIRDSLLDFAIEDRLLAAFRSNPPTGWAEPSAPVDLARNQQEMHAILERAVPGTLLVVAVRYAFEQEIEFAYVHAQASLLRYDRLPPPPDQLRKLKRAERKAFEPKTLLTASVQSDHVRYSPFDKKRPKGTLAYRGHASAWAFDDSAPTRKALETGIAEVVELIDLRSQERLLPVPKVKPLKVWTANVAGMAMRRKARLIAAGEARTTVERDSIVYRVDNRQLDP